MKEDGSLHRKEHNSFTNHKQVFGNSYVFHELRMESFAFLKKQGLGIFSSQVSEETKAHVL